jgi:hypothetical protein
MICAIVKYDILDEVTETRLQLLCSINKAEVEFKKIMTKKQKK